MAIFRKDNGGGFGAGGFVKKHTTGTSNEISFSVLDAKSSNSNAPEVKRPRKVGGVALFTLPGKFGKKVNATPTKEQGLPLQSGEFAAGGGETIADEYVPGMVSVESSDSLTKRKPRRVQHMRVHGPRKGEAPAGGSSQEMVAAEPPAKAAKKADTRNSVPKNPKGSKKPKAHAGRKVALAGGVVVLIAALAGVGLFLGKVYMQSELEHQMQSSKLRVALNDIVKIDSTLIAMDEVLTSEISIDSYAAISEIQEEALGLDELFDEAEQIATVVGNQAVDSNDKQAAENALRALKERRAMLDSGLKLMKDAQAGAQMVELVDSAWEQVYSADALTRQAAQTASGSLADLTQAISISNQAYLAMSAAHEKLSSAYQMFIGEPDLDAQIEYAAVRAEGLRHAIASNQALLESNVELAQSESDLYNQAEEEAAEIAQTLPEDKTASVIALYNESIKDAAQEYLRARENAAQADSFLRNYLSK